MLTLPEELYLLAHDECTGRLRGRRIDRGLCGAVLAELVLQGRIRVTPATVRVLDASPIAGEPLLNDALGRLAATRELFSPEEWLAKLRGALPVIRLTVREDVERRLSAGVQHFGTRARHVVAESTRQGLVDDLRSVLVAGAVPGSRTVTRVALLGACSLLDIPFGPAEIKEGTRRAMAVARSEPIGDAIWPAYPSKPLTRRQVALRYGPFLWLGAHTAYNVLRFVLRR